MSCDLCIERPACLEPCPSCGNEGTYADHATTGFAQCRGCDPKICTDCAYGARYTCDYFRMRNSLPPSPPKLERQINEVHWEIAKEMLEESPELVEVEVERVPGKYVYVLRIENGEMRRLSSAEACKVCEDVDIRRDVYAELYARLGQFVCAKCLCKIKCSCGSSCSPSSCSSCMCGQAGSP